MEKIDAKRPNQNNMNLRNKVTKEIGIATDEVGSKRKLSSNESSRSKKRAMDVWLSGKSSPIKIRKKNNRKHAPKTQI
jgi:hypothetical protein